VRIAAFLAVLPTIVYLHAGTRHGAAALGLPAHRATLAISALPAPLQTLAADDVENFLCCYKHEFGLLDAE